MHHAYPMEPRKRSRSLSPLSIVPGPNPMSRIRRALFFIVPILILIFVIGQSIKVWDSPSSLSLRILATQSRQSVAQSPAWKSMIRLGATHPTIGKCTVAHGKLEQGYHRALETHLAHSEYHGYPTYLLDHSIIEGLWTKEAALLEVVLDQLSKPEDERLRWLFWFDADTVVMNREIPLEAFLPPSDRDDIHLLYTKDWNGLNNGVFILRVSTWSLEMLSSILAYRTFKPDEELAFTEQTAMERIIAMPQYKDNVVQCPPQWFNAYPGEHTEELDGRTVHFGHRPGQLLVHFAGVGDKDKAIREWVDKLKGNRSAWEIDLYETTYPAQIEAFWQGLKREKEMIEDPRKEFWG